MSCCAFSPGAAPATFPGRLVVIDVVDHDEVLTGVLFTKLPDHCHGLWRATVLLHFCDEVIDFGVR